MDDQTKKELTEIANELGKLKSRLEDIRDDYQNYYDSMPEDWQEGDVGTKVETDIDQLSEVTDNLDSIEDDVFGLAKSIPTKTDKPDAKTNGDD